MRLTRQQREQFERDGYLFFPGLFSADEVGVLNDAVPELYSRREAYNVREKDSDAVRTNFAAHLYSAPFARLARHPRMVQPVKDLLGEDAVHAPVQDQRQDGLRRRRLAVAPGLRHLAQRRPDAQPNAR